MTKQLYLKDTYLFELNALIAAKKQDDRGAYVLLDQTVFYPQGGGQPSDQGIMRNNILDLKITSVRQIGNEIRHYLGSGISEVLENQNVLCVIDKERRILNAKYHTAGHLLGNVTEVIYPSLKAIKGHSFPNEAYVEFQGDELPDITKLQDSLDKAIAEGKRTIIFEMDPMSFEQKFYKLPYQIPDNKVFRIMQIEGFLPVPCGGTHLSRISEIGSMTLEKIKVKNSIIRISYEVHFSY